MMKIGFIAILPSILAFIVNGCTSPPSLTEIGKTRVEDSIPRSAVSGSLKCQILDLPMTAKTGQTISFRIRVQNLSSKTQLPPISEEVEICSSSRFIADAPPGEFVSKIRASGRVLSGDYAIARNSMSTCPPQFDYLKAGETRDYNFQWKPQKSDNGTGALWITLPYQFPELPLQPMRILKN